MSEYKLYLLNPSGKLNEDRFKDLMDDFGESSFSFEELKDKGVNIPKVPCWSFSDSAALDKAYEELNGKKKWNGTKKPKFMTESLLGEKVQEKMVLQQEQERKKIEREQKKVDEAKVVTYPQSSIDVFPYSIKDVSCKKSPLKSFHSRLLEGNYDIACEVKWTSLTPASLSPCDNLKKSDEALKSTWLTSSGKLCISPFTVKSAVASAYSLLRGSCLRTLTRIIDNNGAEATGGYPYPGRYKRYRVSQSNSKFGIIKTIDKDCDPVRITIQPVKEVCSSEDGNFDPGEIYRADLKFQLNNRSGRDDVHKPMIASNINKKIGKDKIVYIGAYKAGADAHFTGPELEKRKYLHRFYKLDASTLNNGNVLAADIPTSHFDSLGEVRKKVYVGGYAQNSDPKIRLSTKQKKYRETGAAWHQDLNELKPGDPIYYQELDGKIASIGKNFNYKTIFSLEEAVRPGDVPCTSINEICPRCALVGFVDHNDSHDKEKGYKGRFKSCTLVSERTIDDTELIKLPVQMAPKANKRDVKDSLYYKDGMAAGRKFYTHASFNSRDIESLKKFCDKPAQNSDLKSEKMDSYRDTVRVCSEKTTFTGTLGAENINLQDLAALLFALESFESGHGYKLGRGKSIGMGSFTSDITKIWLRGSDYKWTVIPVEHSTMIASLLEAHLPGFAVEWDRLKEESYRLNQYGNHYKRSPKFPDIGLKYWRDAQSIAVK